jgi:two-component system sensor histidine kinase/response regulator
MLRKFAAGQKSATTDTHQALEANDWETAERRIHTLKGLSGTIGATLVQHRAEFLETTIRTRQPRGVVDGSLADLTPPLLALITHLEQIPPEAPDQTPVTAEEADLKVVCGTLEAFLSNDDSEASDVLDLNAGLLRVAFPNHFLRIADHIRSYEFDLALVALRAATAGSA